MPVVLFIFFFAMRPAQAADKTWDGEGPDPFWQTGANWDPTGGGGNAPVPNDSLFFDGTANTSPFNDFPGNTLFNGITFNSSAAPFTLGGNNIFLNSAGGSATAQNIGGSITNNSANPQTILFITILADGKHLIVNNGAGKLALGGIYRGLSVSNNPVVVHFLKTGAGDISAPNLTNVNGIIGGWALFGTDWAANLNDPGNTIVAYNNYTDIAGNGVVPSDPTANVRITNAASGVTLQTNLTDINSLYYGVASPQTVNIGAGNTLRLGAYGGVSRGAATTAALTIGLTGSSNGVFTAGGAANTDGEIVLDAGGAAVTSTTITINSQIKDNGTGKVRLIKTGQAACQLLSQSNSFSGGTYIAQGRLQASSVNSLNGGPVTVLSGGQAFLTGAGFITNDFFISGIGTTEGNGLGAIRMQTGSGITNKGNITLASDARIAGGGSSTPGNILGKITGGFRLELGSFQTINGTIILSNTNNNWGGDTTIIGRTNGGGFNIIKLGASEVIPNGSGKGNVFISGSSSTNGGALDLNGFNETINGLTALNPVNNAIITNSASGITSTLTVGDNDATTTWSGNIKSGSGPIDVVKVGSGTLTFDNANTYTGNTLVNAGTLKLTGSGSIASSPTINVASGVTFDVSGVTGGFTLGGNQTLKGYGTVIGALGVSGTISPGGSVGTINSGSETWSGGGTYTWEINDATGSVGVDPGWDLINISGGLNITASAGSKFNINITSLSGSAAGSAANFSSSTDYTWTILKTATSITGFDPSALNVNASAFSNALPANGKFIVELSGSGLDIVIKYGHVPVITTQPTNSTVAAGGSKTFYVAADGSPTLTYQWRKNGVNIAGAVNSSYTINPVRVSDAGTYDVVVANSFGSAASSAAGLNVTCPAITVSPSSLPSGMVGDTYSRTITASGGTPSYTFAVTSGSLPAGLALAADGTLAGTLTTSAIYNFTITATDAYGCTGSRSYTVAANITVTNSINSGYNLIANQLDTGGNTLNEIMPSAPDGCYIFKYDNNVGSYLGASLYSSATATWSPGNIPLNPGEGAFLYSPTSFSLIFTGVVHVPVLPLAACKGYRLLSRQTNDIGSFDNIIGSAPQGGEAVYKWTGSGYSTFTFDGAIGIWTPTTPSTAVGEAVWIYTPTGPNCSGGANGLTAPPVITTQPLSQTVAVGANVTFTVVATGGGTLTYQWRLNGVNISGATTSSLNLINVQPSNSGDYTVVVANNGGATESQVAKLLLTIVDGGFADYFTNRVTTNSSAGSVSGNNLSATKETGEPNHAGNPGGKSVWYAWQAPANGIATFNTKGSSFDTLLAIYTGTNVASLKRIASDNDSGGYSTSQVKFNAVAGTIYYIAMDGSYGASGNIVLTWSLEITASAVPEITVQPQSQAAGPGDNVTLSVTARAGTVALVYQWYLNDDPVSGATNASYTITGLNVSKIGIYKVHVSTVPPDPREVVSAPAAVQLSTVEVGGMVAVGTFDKFLDSVFFTNSSGGGGEGFLADSKKGGGGGPKVAPAAGFTGTQIFSTVGSSKEPGEPNHCGEPGGASEWFTYQAPASGHLYIDTTNSNFDTVLAIYTGPNPMTNFADLVAVGCANIAATNGGEEVDFDATNATLYYIAVDGVGGTSGIVNLNYNLVTAPPNIASAPQSHSVTQAQNGTLTVSMANSTTPLHYQWQFSSTNISGATTNSYTRSNFQLSHQGNYRVVVTNNGGAVTSGPAMMYLNVPAMRATNFSINSTGYFQTRWFGPTNSMLALQFSTNLNSSNWVSIKTNTLTNGITTFTDDNALGLSNHFYRVRLLFP